MGTVLSLIFIFDNLTFAFRRLPVALAPVKLNSEESEKHGKFEAISFAFIIFPTGSCPLELILQEA